MGLFSRKKRNRSENTSPDVEAVDAGSDDEVAEVDEELEADDFIVDLRTNHLDEFADLLDREWDRLANAGTWWTGGERIAIARDTRHALAGEPLTGILPRPVEEATRRVATDAASIRGIDVARWESEGLDSFAFVEIVGVVSRLTAIDTAAYGLRLPLRALPEARPGEPTQLKPEGAGITTGWVPTVGPASAPSALSAVVAEAAAMRDLHAVLYTHIDEMFELPFDREGLSRPQMELAAARTSALNHCLFELLGHASMLRSCITPEDRRLTAAPITSGVGDTGVLAGAEIVAFVDAVVLRDHDEFVDAREALEAKIGSAASDRVAMVAGNFEMMSRALDAIGAPVNRDHEDLAAEMGRAIPDHLATAG